jgi:hypothetical protein
MSETDWKPIETAPRDGTPIIGYATNGWSGVARREAIHRTVVKWHPTGVWVTVPSDYPVRATLWQPLPDLPTPSPQ